MKAEKVMLSAGMFLLRTAVLVLVIAGIWRLGEFTYTYAYGVVSDAAVDPEPGRDVSVMLTSDMDAKDAAKLLEMKGLVEDKTIFWLQMKLAGYEDKLKPGQYDLNTSMTPRAMMKIMAGEEETEED